MIEKQVDHDRIKWKMKIDYSHASADRNHKALEGVQGLISQLNVPNVNLHDFLQKTADMIVKTFRLRSVTIGLRGQDGKYRYEVMAGKKDEAWTFEKSLVYEEQDFLDSDVYKGEMVSKLTKIFLVEDMPYPEAEKEAFNRPFVLGLRRRTAEDWVEGDYMDVFVKGSDGLFIGWIEVTGTADGRLPDIATIKWLETIASILSVRIEMKRR